MAVSETACTGDRTLPLELLPLVLLLVLPLLEEDEDEDEEGLELPLLLLEVPALPLVVKGRSLCVNGLLLAPNGKELSEVPGADEVDARRGIEDPLPLLRPSVSAVDDDERRNGGTAPPLSLGRPLLADRPLLLLLLLPEGKPPAPKGAVLPVPNPKPKPSKPALCWLLLVLPPPAAAAAASLVRCCCRSAARCCDCRAWLASAITAARVSLSRPGPLSAKNAVKSTAASLYLCWCTRARALRSRALGYFGRSLRASVQSMTWKKEQGARRR